MGIIFLLFPPISHSSFLLKLHNIPLNQFPNDGHLDDPSLFLFHTMLPSVSVYIWRLMCMYKSICKRELPGGWATAV